MENRTKLRVGLALTTWAVLIIFIWICVSYPYFGMFVLGMQAQAVISMTVFKGWDETVKTFKVIMRPYVGLLPF